MLTTWPEISLQPASGTMRQRTGKKEKIRKRRSLFEKQTIKTKLAEKFFLIEDPKYTISVKMMKSRFLMEIIIQEKRYLKKCDSRKKET